MLTACKGGQWIRHANGVGGVRYSVQVRPSRALLGVLLVGLVACGGEKKASPAAPVASSAETQSPEGSADGVTKNQPAPCKELEAKLCRAAPCEPSVTAALAAANPKQCIRWLSSSMVVSALARTGQTEAPLADVCGRLVKSACELAPSICDDMRAVVLHGVGPTDETATCKKVLSSPRLMTLLAQRLAVIEFAAKRSDN